ncbi:CHAT domain-containing protein [Umezawaea sp.]|uniref:CHAT domain-containing protein n=1 Tax=Umezawaea sp. TaxID=1955258 RepID=UPI002ED2F92A
MAVEFTVRGKGVAERSDRDDFAELYGDDVRYEVRGEVRLTGVSRGEAEAVALDGEDSDVVEVEDSDGVVTFHRAGGLVERAGGGDLTAYLDSTTRGGGARLAAVRRSAVAVPQDVREAVRVVDAAVGAQVNRSGLISAAVDLAVRPLFDEAARAAMRKVVDWIDEPVSPGDHVPDAVWRRRPKPRGVYQIGEDLRLARTGPLKSAPPSADDPFLVLLHGTFSHTEGAFTALRDTAEWRAVAARYRGRILAVEHATLGLTPAQNALHAAAHLPEGSRLHLISHSRGGLVGEALSYAAKHRPVLDTFPDGHPDRDALPRLREVLVDRGVTVERFVRVACPARGTTLASHRVDRWASFLFNVFTLVPGLRETGIAALVKKFLLTFLEQRTDPRIVPGLEAQMPESPFLRMLLSAQSLDDGLGSIAGDVQGAGIARRLLTLGADLFYREDHDYVVPTSSMSGGATRTTPRTRSFQGGDVNHGAYFANPDSRRAVKAWLEAKPGEAVEGFEPRVAPRSQGRRGGVDAAVQGEVLLVPDVFGCALSQGGLPTWPDVSRFVGLRAERVLTGQTRPEALVPAYAELEGVLGERHRVVPFPYNPRVSFEQSAARLAKHLRARVDGGGAPHLVAHGTGAFVVLGALGTDGLHAAWRAAGGRAVLLGPPLDGSPLVEARLAGRDELTAAIALLDGGATTEEVGSWLGTWPTLTALLPGAAAERAALLPADWSGISAVHGTADQTVSGGTAAGGFTVSSDGDGFAPHTGRRVRGPATWYALVPHADLPSDPDVAAVVLDLLAGRSPARMLTSPPAGSPREAPMPDPRGRLLLPTDDEVVRTAWGGGRSTARQALRVSVVHGHLGSVRGPVLVGHQDGTSIGGAERAVDDHLNRALERRLDMRQYPGPLGTCEVFGNADGPAAVVIGVGDAGDLTPGALTAGVIQAVLRLAAVHEDRALPDVPPPPLSVSAVLIGTALVPPMPVENSLSAIVTGVRQANRRLRDLRAGAFVEELRIVELYEERAIQATKAATQLARSLHGEVVVERLMLESGDGESGLPRPDYHDDMWRTVRIVAADPEDRVHVHDHLVELSFTSIGRHARAEQRVNTSQRGLLDELVAEAVADVNPDAQLFNTLYELLVPTGLKGQGYGSEHLMVVVDEQAGVLPLEMLATRTEDEGVLPLAVQVGVIRRLESRTFTELTRPSSGNAALVVGDPAGTGLPRLPGARAEAHHVRELLQGMGYDVTSIIPGEDAEEDVVDILNALFRRDYRIVHITGHGHHDPADPTRSGVRIGHDAYLGALEIAKMRTAPDLVFVNCCHTGAMGRSGEPVRADRLASSVARQLVENGVRAVIAAGWAVDDAAAEAFADAVYGELLGGRDLGIATLEARKRVYRDFPSTNTWGAYQVYGPPAFRLDPASRRTPAPERPVARREFADRLDDLKRRAAGCRDDEVGVLADELRELLATVPSDWLRGQERSRTGDVWMLLAHYREAVDCYETVRREWDAVGSVKSLEQLVNVQAKWAVERARHPDGPGPDAAVLLAEAERSANLLIQLGETPERYSLLGGVARRRARCVPPDRQADLTAALVAARDAYRRAVELHHERTGEVDFYPALNEVVLGWLVGRRCPEQPLDEDRARTLIARSREAAASARRADFWAQVTEPDAALAEALLGGTLPAEVDAIAKAYARAFVRSSRRDRATVGEHVDVLVRGLPSSCERDVAALRDLRARLAVPTA